MATLSDYDSLSREERLQRIGALLCKAVSLSLMRESRLQESPSAGQGAIEQATETSTPSAVVEPPEKDAFTLLQHFSKFGEFSPKEAMKFLNISRTSTYRKLLRLESSGWIVRQGKTNSARYVITGRLEQVKQIMQSLEAERTTDDHCSEAAI